MNDNGGNPYKKGFTKMPNEMLEKMAMLHMRPNCWRVLMFIIRKTYGYNKQVDYIANSQIVAYTQLCKAVVSRCLRTLQDMGLIIRKGKLIELDENFTGWEKLAVSSTEKKLAEPSTEFAGSSTIVSSCNAAQKKNNNLQKKKYDIPTLKKQTYGEGNNVLLTNQEYAKLVQKFGKAGADTRIEHLSAYIASKGKKYKSHYFTILHWDNMDKKQIHFGTGPGKLAAASGNKLKSLPTGEELKKSWKK